MLPPPNLEIVNVGVTGGAANALVNAQLLAAPGVGLRYRLWAAHVGPNDTAQAVTSWAWDMTGFPLTRGFGRASGANFAGADRYWPGGLAMAANTAMGYQLQSTLAALRFGITVFYTKEAV